MSRRKKSSKWKWFTYALMFFTTTGGGGALLKDHPALASIVHAILGDEVSEQGVRNLVKGKLTQVVSDRVAGRFEVRIKNVELGPEAATGKRGPSLMVRVKRFDAQNREDVIWESSYKTAEREAGGAPWRAGWPDDAFRIDWKPGEKVQVEVEQSSGLFRSTTFVMHETETDAFPLSNGAHVIKMAGVDTPSGKNSIAFETKRVGNLSADATAHVIDRISVQR